MAELAGPRAAGTAVGLVVEHLGGYGAAWVTLAAGMGVALLLLIPMRERAMATS
ncbi:MAG TPA: hypothetical protein VIG07_06945 [Methylomirabilota bacterium]|jgi:hypothetical protein